jgi:hypothetical protein
MNEGILAIWLQNKEVIDSYKANPPDYLVCSQR